MKNKNIISCVCLLVLSPLALFAVTGEVYNYTSSGGVNEKCVVTSKIPGGEYTKKDQTKEKEYCSFDFYDNAKIALCPKTWSTSPGTIVYDIFGSEYNADSYESSQCGTKRKAKNVKTLVKYKQTMNASGTSGTFSTSSLLYYHFSRFFSSEIKVPVAVYREMDKNIHLKRVSKKGLSKTKSKMNRAGWTHLVNAEVNPNSYVPKSDLFTQSEDQIYGVLLRGKGERYGTEFNGTRASGWGVGQNKDFQKTPGFLALRKNKPLLEAIEYGVSQSKNDSKMRPDIKNVSEIQMAFWMKEIIEISLLDYVFSQQDRIGNVDYTWYWYWDENGEVLRKKESRDGYKDYSRRKIGSIPVPEELKALNPILVQRTNLNDNDAGGRIAYANYSKKTRMLEGLSHYSAELYNKLMYLNRDLQSKGEIYNWLSSSLGLTQKRIKQVVTNTRLAAEVLKSQCRDLRFDLDNVKSFLIEGPKEQFVSCE